MKGSDVDWLVGRCSEATHPPIHFLVTEISTITESQHRIWDILERVGSLFTLLQEPIKCRMVCLGWRTRDPS